MDLFQRDGTGNDFHSRVLSSFDQSVKRLTVGHATKSGDLLCVPVSSGSQAERL